MTVHMMAVFALPPKEDCRILVSFESRNGTKSLPDASLLITVPSAKSDWLILHASFSLAPSAFVSFARSDPARSTKFYTGEG